MNQAATIGSARVKDPVCGMTVDPARAKHRAEHAGETFHFCSAGCVERFRKDRRPRSRRPL
jgi:Cu+-exporting ATPase